MAEQASVFQIFGFINTFRKFKSVVSACFGMTLNDNFVKKIEHFKKSYLDLPQCSVTPKVHTAFYHVKQFIDHKKTQLGIYREQATKSIHHIFVSYRQRFKRGMAHPEHEKHLQSCVVNFNSKHL